MNLSKIVKFSFVVLLATSYSFAQNYQIDYKFSIIDNKDEYGVMGFSISRLITNKNESLTFGKNIDTIVSIKGGKEPFIEEATEFKISQYKNFIVGKRYSRTLFPKYNLKDENYTIEWSLGSEFKNILGYNCQIAFGEYRGRTYTAFFTPEIPIQNGPHTFDGLPGLVLEVYSTDNVINFKAIQVIQSNEKIYNPFDADNKEYLSWEEFMIAYKNYFNKMTNYKPDQDTVFVVPNRSIEIYF